MRYDDGLSEGTRRLQNALHRRTADAGVGFSWSWDGEVWAGRLEHQGRLIVETKSPTRRIMLEELTEALCHADLREHER